MTSWFRRATTLVALAAAATAAAPLTALADDANASLPAARFKSLPPHISPGVSFAPPVGANLTQWNGSFKDRTGRTVNFTMPGTDPNTTNVSTTVKVLIVPVKMVYGASNGNMTFDPVTHLVSNGRSVINNILRSPLFDKRENFTTGGVDLGTTQYIDAYQRGNFWAAVSKNTGYHLLLNPTVMPEMTVNVSPTQGQVVHDYFTPGPRGLMDIFAFDALIQQYMAKIKRVNPTVLPLFVTTDVFLTEGGGCCIGGYHSATAGHPTGQTYSHATYIDSVGSFSQDVSAMSHELGEWADDPFTDNFVNCADNSLMENGDPLEGNPNYGGFPYVLNGYTYNLQSLVYLPYFGAPKATSVNSWYSFQDDKATVCPGQ